MGLESRRAFFFLFLVAAVCLIYGTKPASAQFANPQGTKTVIVLSARYAGSPAPALTDAQWATVFTTAISPYYTAATTDISAGVTRSALTFTFLPGTAIGGPATYPLPMAAGTTFDDPAILFKEGLATLVQFDAANPTVMQNPARRIFLIMVNAPKRGRATTVYPFKTASGLWVNLAVTVFSEPVGSAFVSPANTVPALTSTGAPLLNAAGIPVRLVDTSTPAVGAHELGHTVGLPDLYNEDAPPEFVGQWCPMGSNLQNNFSGWSRAYQGWLPADKIFVPTRPAPGATLVTTVNLFPPRTTTNPGIELIMIPTDEQIADWSPTLAAVGRLFGITAPGRPYFTGYIVENRQLLGLDTPVTGATVGGTLLTANLTLGLSSTSDTGLVVSSAKPWIPSQNRPPLNPVTVMHVAAGDSLINAAFNNVGNFTAAPLTAPNFFSDPQRGVRITPLRTNANGSITVEIRWTIPPRPHLTVRDTWIDSPGNGFGTFFTGGSATAANPPFGPGDRVFVPTTVVWAAGFMGIPYPTLVTTPIGHLIQVRVRNTGTVPIARIRGTLTILEPQAVPMNLINPNNIPASLVAVLTALNPITTIPLDSSAPGTFALISGAPGTTLAPGAEANFTVPFTPRGIFMGVPLLDNVVAAPTGTTAGQTEPVEDLADNWTFEPYIILTATAGSPYTPVSLDLPVRNLNHKSNIFMAALDGMGNGAAAQPATWWRTNLDPVFKPIDTNGETHFNATIQPPDPPFKPQLTELGMTAWMNYDDAMIPICRLPFVVSTELKTNLTVSIDSKGNLSGTLTALDMTTHAVKVVKNRKLVLTWSASDGQNKQLLPNDSGYAGTTDTHGNYSQPNSNWISMRPGVRYLAIAEFIGDDTYGPAKSEVAILDLSDNSGKADLVARLPTLKAFQIFNRPGFRGTLGALDKLGALDIQKFGDRLAVVVSNLGSGSADSSVLRVFASEDAYLSKDDVELGRASVPSIKGGRSIPLSVAVHKADMNGAKFIFLVADAEGTVAESNENNNVRSIERTP